MRVRLTETKQQTILWDLKSWTKVEIDKNTNHLTKISIRPDMRKKYEDSLSGSFGLIPFSDIKAVQKNAEWNRAYDQDITATASGVEVYDLIWSEPTDNYITEHYKWRVFVDTTTNLPKRIEWYQKIRNDSKYTLQTISEITYPTDKEVEAVIQSIFN
jgi:hypothetical protein